MPETIDCAVVGAGVVGLACGVALANTGREVLVLEAEDQMGSHSSSRNSEVIHAGIYYPKESLKAELCRRGKERLYAYAAEMGVGHKRIGKLVVTTRADQEPELHRIKALAENNGVDDLKLLTAQDITALEPQVSAESGLLSSSTGIIDSHALMLALAGELEAAGGMIVCRTPVEGLSVDDDGVVFRISGDEATAVRARTLINSAGLNAISLARTINQLGDDCIPDAHYAIGHYYKYTGRSPCERLIYPVPNAGGLGVHLTLDLGGQARFGPDVRWIDKVDYRFDHSRFEEFLEAVRQYLPNLAADKLGPDYCGIRPKITGPHEAPADFRIDGPEVHGIDGLINLFGIESPGLTAALAIGDLVAEMARP